MRSVLIVLSMLIPLGPEPSALAPALLPVCDLSILFIFAVYVNL